MPRSVIATGLVDAILPVDQIGSAHGGAHHQPAPVIGEGA
jgi:chemotaxis response regulator CheB